MATVFERLHERLGDANEDAYGRALRVLSETLPVDRKVDITDEAIAAAVAGDVVLLRCLFAPEEEPADDELTALAELTRDPERDNLLTTGEVRRALD